MTVAEGRRKGSGRTKGATSLVSVKMSDLQGKFGPNDIVVVGRIFCRKAGLEAIGPAISEPLSEEVKAGIQLIAVPNSEPSREG